MNDKRTRGGKANLVKFVIWAPWILAITGAAVSAGGFRAIAPLYLTESGISIDAPEKYYMYFTVLFVFLGLSLIFGRRAGCHYICWMAPFMMAGTYFGRTLKVPSLHLTADPRACTGCGLCTKKCPMSLDVQVMVKRGLMYDSECAMCFLCADSCPRKAISLRLGPAECSEASGAGTT